MKKKIGIALAVLLVMAVVLSIKAHAEESPQAVIDTEGSKTSISITDITPREDEENETDEQKTYTVSSYYPIEVQTAEDHGIQLLVKTFLVPADTDPQTLVEGDLTRRGIAYEPSDVLRRELPENVEKKSVTQTVTMDSETDKLDEILPLLNPTLDYSAEGFSGVLTLDKGSIQTKETGTSSYAYQLKETKEYTGLDRNDPYYIPKTTEKNGVTLSLADVDWTPMASAADHHSDEGHSQGRNYPYPIFSWAEMYDAAGLEAKKMIISCLIKRVEVYRGYKVQIKFNTNYQQFGLGAELGEIVA